MTTRHFELTTRANHPDLKACGFGIEQFPSFTSVTPVLHTHDLIELVYVCSGEGVHILGKKEYPAVAGSLAIIHHNQAHGFKTGAGGLSLINLYIDIQRFVLPVMPKALQGVLPLLIPLHPRIRHNLRDIVYIQFPQPAVIKELLLRMEDELKARREGFHEALHHYVALFLIEACRSYMNQRQLDSAAKGPKKEVLAKDFQLQQLCRYLQMHFAEPLRLDALAARVGLQKNYLCRTFKAHTGQTLFSYIIYQRLGQAMLLLRQTERSVVEIALSSGFNDLPHFNRIFRREVGMTPREYRKQWQ
jgi:AraC family L-rhamnose operon transcriptional activator RhaR